MGIITDLLKEIPLSAVLKERLVETEKNMAALEKENAALKHENSVLAAKNQHLTVALQKAQDEISRLKEPPIQQQPNYGSQPRIKGRMER